MGWKVISWEKRGNIVHGILENLETGEIVRIEENLEAGTSLEFALD